MMEELLEIDVARSTYVTQIITSINQIHASGVIRRDLPPSNLMKNREVRVTLTGFGVASSFENQIPHDERFPYSNNDGYSVECDINALERLLSMSYY